jgi:hypothetical protein
MGGSGEPPFDVWEGTTKHTVDLAPTRGGERE